MCCVALGPDNRTAFALVGGPARTRFWKEYPDRWALVDLENGEVVKEGSLGQADGIWAAYSPDGRHVAAGGLDGDVAIIDTRTGQLVREAGPGARGDGVYWVAFSDDGARLVSGAIDGTVVLWDADDRRHDRSGHPSRGCSRLADVPAERRHHDRPVAERTPPSTCGIRARSTAVEFACRAAGRDLTEAEWAEHFPGQPFRSVCPQS